MSSPTFADLEKDYNEGQNLLDELANSLSITAKLYSKSGNWLRFSVILLGALVLAREAFEKIWGETGKPSPAWIIGFFAVVGILTAVAGGVLSTFKFETRAAEMKVIAAQSQATAERFKTAWKKALFVSEPQLQIEMALGILEKQDVETEAILAKAAQQTNITRRILKQQKKASLANAPA